MLRRCPGPLPPATVCAGSEPPLPGVRLIATAPPDARGSMARYAWLVAQALHAVCPSTKVERVDLASFEDRLWRVPRRLANWAHHGRVGLAAVGLRPLPQGWVTHVLDGSHAYVARGVRGKRPCGGPLVVTVHDLIPVLQAKGRFPLPPPGPAARFLIGRSLAGLRRADLLVADSRHTADDLVREAGIAAERVMVVPLAVAPTLVPGAPPTPWRTRAAGADAFVLHVGNDGFFKNRAGTLRIFARLRRERPLRLVLAGPAPSAGLRRLAASLGVAPWVDFVSDPDDAALAALYRSAALLLFPSRYEGFGWPPLEAMANGCPVVASSAASVPEVVGDAGVLVSPDDEEAFARACAEVFENPMRTEALVAAGLRRAARFSPERMGADLLAAYGRAAAFHRRRAGEGGQCAS